MRRLGRVLIVVLMLPLAATAQTEPRLEVTLPEGEIIVGQPATLRMKLLVPTWMPKPPVWPTLEVPSLMVRLPERASTPVSETINGETWSGVSRGYRLYPLAAQDFTIPAQNLEVTYADPADPAQTITDNIAIKSIAFPATLPQEAADLDPPIVAQSFTLEQTFDGPPEMETGGAITRTVIARIDGTTPILIPGLVAPLPTTSGAGAKPAANQLRAYPKEPVVEEAENRGTLSGSRTESVTYVAQAGGAASLPALELQWFNLESGVIELAHLPGVELTITAPPPPPPGPVDYAIWAAKVLGALVAIWLAFRIAWPWLRAGMTRWKAAWLASERFAALSVRQALQSGELGEIYAALDRWDRIDRGPPPAISVDRQALENALAQMGGARFSSPSALDNGDTDRSIRRSAVQAFNKMRANLNSASRMAQKPGRLPPLNP